ncbi:MAG: alpha/beta hydrolase, partial [Candidatus Marinimicrobia bacterium]|nr:alpha/beta hydrolase [Candidatus Neomarinimicrobiota bacterium]
MAELKHPHPQSQSPVFAVIRVISAILCRVAPPLAVKWADRLFFTPVNRKRPQSELPAYKSAQKSFIDFKGLKVALFQWGHGDKTVILLHGWGSRGTRLGNLAPAFNERGYRVLAFDMIGHGDSDGKITNLAEMSELLATIYKDYGPVSAFVGHSFGGMVISAAIHRFDLKVQRVAIVGSPFTLDHFFESFGEMINITPAISE